VVAFEGRREGLRSVGIMSIPNPTLYKFRHGNYFYVIDLEKLTWQKFAENPKEFDSDAGTVLTIYLRANEDITELTMPRPINTIQYKVISAPQESMPAQAEGGKVYSQTRRVRAK
jgi:hypothetical protein